MNNPYEATFLRMIEPYENLIYNEEKCSIYCVSCSVELKQLKKYNVVKHVNSKQHQINCGNQNGTFAYDLGLMVKLYKMNLSPPARAVMMACELFNVPVEMVDVDLQNGEHLKPEFLKLNPLHAVPVLEDGDLIIHDSQAILMYLADVYGAQETFYPKDPKQRVLVNQKLFFSGVILYNTVRNISIPLIMGETKTIPQQKLDAVEETYGYLEEFLTRSKYLAGDNITIADLSAYAFVSSLDLIMLNINAQKFPKSYAWLKELEKLPYVQKGNAQGLEEYKEFINSRLY